MRYRILLLMLLSIVACETQYIIEQEPSVLEFEEWSKGLPKVGEWRTDLAIGDLNGDGWLDIGGLPRKGPYNASIWLNQHNGSWELFIEGIPHKFECGVGVDFGDVNNDGKLDVAFGRHCDKPWIFLNNESNWVPYSEGLVDEGVNPIAFEDFDNDGKLEVITSGAFLEGYRIYSQEEEWVEWKNTNLAPRKTSSSFELLTPDLNNDGFPDIVSTGGKLDIYINRGDKSFVSVDNLPEGFYTYLAAGDLNNDGLIDIAVNGEDLLVLTQPNWNVTNLSRHCISSDRGGVAIGDVDKDGSNELLATCKNGFLLFDDYKLKKTNLPTLESTPQGLKLRDMNNDGKLDVVSAFGTPGSNNGTGGIYVWIRKN